MIESLFFEDYVTGSSRTTLGRTITESDIVIHAGQTGDFYPHHMDAEWCRTQPFGQRVAHGTLIFSVAVGMTAGKIVFGIIERRFESLRVGAAGPTHAARKDVAAVKTETEVMLGDGAAGAAWTLAVVRACHCRGV